MYYLVFLGSLILFSATVFILDRKKVGKNTKMQKIYAIALVLVFFLRYFFYNERPINCIGLNSFSGMNSFLVLTCCLFSWFSYAGVLFLAMKPFYKVKNVENLIKFFFTFVFLVEAAIVPFTIDFLIGEGVSGTWNFTAVMYAIELGLCLALCLNTFLLSPSLKMTREEKKNILLTIIPVLIAVMPSYVPQVFFGYGNPTIDARKLSQSHRLFLYGACILPVIIYFIFRNKSLEIRRFSIGYLGVATMVAFTLSYKFDVLLNPVAWPIQLCNTAMFVVPFCILANKRKLIYFTYFINVMGAMMAMAMPNYGNANILSFNVMKFWLNHYIAFFLPLLCIALGLFERPRLKEFYYSMVGFCVYFFITLILNVWFANYDADVNYFFLNGDYVPDQLGNWAERIYYVKVSFSMFGLNFVFHPVYQSLFFLVYVGIAFAIWFVYEQFFSISEQHREMLERKRKIKLDKFALMARLNGRELSEPMYETNGAELQLINFTKRYGASKVYAVKDANLTVHGGEIFGFLGPNGAGKSTIIKSIVGIQPIGGGEIRICGYDCEKQSVMAKRQIGYVPDHYTLYEKLTGREYINYIADIYDVTREDRDARIEDMVKRFELDGSFDTQIKTYSHGMKQKITIMAALVHDPKIWILDEPLTGLDPNSIFQVKECMREHAKKGNIVFFSSHIIDVVERICDKISIIKKGHIVVSEMAVSEIEKQCPLEDYYMQIINGSETENVSAEKVEVQ